MHKIVNFNLSNSYLYCYLLLFCLKKIEKIKYLVVIKTIYKYVFVYNYSKKVENFCKFLYKYFYDKNNLCIKMLNIYS